MSYMGPRYIGGGQIFPGGAGGSGPNQNQGQQGYQPPQFNLQRQFMGLGGLAMQLQQNLQNQMKNQANANQNKNPVPLMGKSPSSGPGGQNMKNSNSNVGKGMGPSQIQSNSNNNQQNKDQNSANKNLKDQKPNINQNQMNKGQENSNATQANKNQSNSNTGPKQDNRNSNTTQNKANMKPEPYDKTPGKPSRFGSSAPGSQNSKPPPPPPSSPSQGSNQQSQRNSGPQQQQRQSSSLMGRPPPLMGSAPGVSPGQKDDMKNSQQPQQQQQQQQQPQQQQQQMQRGGDTNQGYRKGGDYYNQYQNSQSQGQGYDQGYDQGKQNQQNSYRNYGDAGGRGAYHSPKNVPPSEDRARNLNKPPPDLRSRLNKPMRPQGAPQSHNIPQRGGRPGGYFSSDKLKEKVLQIFNEPQLDLPPLDMNEKKFNNQAKLFVGNIPKNTEQSEITSLFEQFGEIGSVYLNKDSGFAFINFDFKVNAGKALRELDNHAMKNRHLKVRFATISEGIRIKNLSPYVSNELLEKAFSIFGMVESCRVTVDERGISKGEGIIIYRDKKSAVMAVKKCQEECFFLSGAMRPVIVTSLEPLEDTTEGLPESSLPKNEDYRTEREIAPHFADSNSFEYDFGHQWKQLYNMYEEKKSVLDRDFQIEMARLEKKMVLAKVEYEAEKLRKELAQREAESAELRRHFEYDAGGSAIPASSAAGPTYDPYPGSKRPLDQGYDSSYNVPYDQAYNDNYDRGGYTSTEYDRTYDQGYGAYGRDEYRREGGYAPEDPYDRPPYDRPNDLPPPERPMFDTPADQGYPAKPTETPVPAGAPNKRPRY